MEKATITLTKEQLHKELMWWRDYGAYVAKRHNNVDAEACGFADGDEEYV